MEKKESTLEKNREADIGILNLWPFKNYGGVLVAYALQKTLKKLGYSSKLINWQFSKWREEYPGSFVEDFANKYLDFTPPYYDYSDLINNINDLADTFIVGADCVWAPFYFKDSLFFFPFVDSSKKKISYAPSFMNEHYDCPPDLLLSNKYYLSRFDSISVREDSGLKILKDVFGVEATQVLDPTLLLDKNDYGEIISRDDAPADKDYVCVYLIHKYYETSFEDLKQRISSLVDNKKLVILRQQESEKSVSEWLDLIVNSKVLITNSYHACCFAILFNIPFYVYNIPVSGYSRHESLMRVLGLEERIKYNTDDFEKDMLFDPIDWEKVKARLEKERIRSIDWLKEALEKPKDVSGINPADPVIHYLNKNAFTLNQSVSALNQNISTLSQNIFALSQSVSMLETQKVYSQDLFDIFNYRKYIFNFWKYRILKNLVFGKKKKKYKYKQKAYKFKIDYVKNLMQNYGNK